MTDGQAQQWVVVSAVGVSGIYFYRKLTMPAIPATAHQAPGAQAPLGRWLVGFGVAFFGISLVATMSPDLGGWLAILLLAGTVLTNGLALAADVNSKVSK